MEAAFSDPTELLTLCASRRALRRFCARWGGGVVRCLERRGVRCCCCCWSSRVSMDQASICSRQQNSVCSAVGASRGSCADKSVAARKQTSASLGDMFAAIRLMHVGERIALAADSCRRWCNLSGRAAAAAAGSFPTTMTGQKAPSKVHENADILLSLPDPIDRCGTRSFFSPRNECSTRQAQLWHIHP